MRLLLLVSFLFCTQKSYSHIELPRPSPFQKVEQKVGITDVTLEYCRPSMKGRKIFGGLEEYGDYWRIGANKNTKLTFSDPFIIDKDTIEAGSYALFAEIEEKEWELYLYKETENWGLPDSIEQSKIAKQITLKVETLPAAVETLDIDFENLSDTHCDLVISWEKTSVTLPIDMLTSDKILSDIDETLKSQGRDFFVAAKYYFEEEVDIVQADIWVDKAIELDYKHLYWAYKLKAEIAANQGRKAEAVEAAEKGLEIILPYNSDYHTNLFTELVQEMKGLD